MSKQDAGQKGGNATVKKYGLKYMKDLGRKGAAVEAIAKRLAGKS